MAELNLQNLEDNLHGFIFWINDKENKNGRIIDFFLNLKDKQVPWILLESYLKQILKFMKHL